jgi:hypothetical protein
MVTRDLCAVRVSASRASCAICITLKASTKNKLNLHQLKDLERFNLMAFQMCLLGAALQALISTIAREWSLPKYLALLLRKNTK